MVRLLAILAYLLGSLPFTVLLSRWLGTQDPRASGSGNSGATNMLCVAGKKLVILTLFGDVGKGLLPVLAARRLGLGVMEEVWVGIATAIGHLYPLYFNFRGGKSIVTAAGVLLGFYLPVVLLAAVVWLLIFKLSRTGSLALLVVTPLTLPLLAWQQPGALLSMTVLTGLIVWRYCANLRDLFAGREWHF